MRTNTKTKIKKIVALLIIWGLIPLIIDVINIILLRETLPFFMLMRDFSFIEIALSFAIWFGYSLIVMIFQFAAKKISNARIKKEQY